MKRELKSDILSRAAGDVPSHENPRCESCGLCRTTYHPFTFPLIRGSIVFITSSPNMEEEQAREMGYGLEYTVIRNHICKPLGITEGMFSVFPAVLCRPPDRKGKKVDAKKNQADMCRPFINHLLQRVKRPRRIIVMGSVAARAVLQRDVALKDEIGYVYRTNFGDVTVTFSPSILLQKDVKDEGMPVGYIDMMREHVRRFVHNLPHVEFPPMEVV